MSADFWHRTGTVAEFADEVLLSVPHEVEAAVSMDRVPELQLRARVLSGSPGLIIRGAAQSLEGDAIDHADRHQHTGLRPALLTLDRQQPHHEVMCRNRKVVSIELRRWSARRSAGDTG